MSKVKVNKHNDKPTEHHFLPAEFSWDHLEKMFRDMRSYWPFQAPQASSFQLSDGGMLNPQVDIKETKASFEISAELPGIDLNDIDLEINSSGDASGNILTLSGKKESKKDSKDDDNYYLMERSYGFFRRTFALPNNVDQSKINANFKNGVLQITMPKTESLKKLQQKIAINS